MKKIYYLFLASVILAGCGSKETYEAQIAQYNLHVTEANTYYKNGEYDKALLSSTKAVEITDTLSPALLQRGHANIMLSNWKEAKDDYSDAIDIEGEKSEAFKGRSIANYYLDERGDFIDDINIYIVHNDNDIFAHERRADYYTEEEEYNKAIADYSVCLKLAPNNASYYLKRGNAYSMVEDNRASIADYENYTRLSPGANHDQIFYKRALLNMKVNQHQKAISDLLLISNGANKPAVQQLLADNYFSLKDYDQSVINYSAYLRSKPKDYDALVKRGDAYLAKNNIPLANADFQQAALLQWDDKGFFYKYGWWILFAIGYSFIGLMVFGSVKEEYDNRKIGKGYLYYVTLGLFGGHHAYTKSTGKFFLVIICILAFTFLNSFSFRSYYNHYDLLWSGILATPYSIYLLYGIIALLVLDIIMLPYYVYSSNHDLRNAIDDRIPKERNKELDTIAGRIKKQNSNLKKLNL